MKNLQKKIENLIGLYKSKRYLEAESFCKDLIESNPKIAFLYNLMGIILFDQNKKVEAIDYYQRGIKIDPKFALIYNNLGNVYKSQNKLKDAEEYYKKSIDTDHTLSEPHNNLGNLLRSLNKYQEAIQSYNKAIDKNKNFFWAYYNLATTQTSLGNYSDAKDNLEKTIELNPFFCSAHRSLSRIKEYKKSDDKHLIEMIKIYKNKNIKNDQKKELGFAIGKAYEDIKDYVSSFEYYKNANYLQRKLINFSINDEKKDFDNIKKVYNSKMLAKIRKIEKTLPKIIFIVGMPRSGTTLVEQIISSHPNVYGCDELNFIPNLYEKNRKNLNFDSNALLEIGNEYIDKVNKISNNSSVVTDKLPINFKWLGFIKLILPNSKIIHCTRSSKDNCFSIFKSFFPNQINFAFDIDEIVKFYNLYLDLMKHWNNCISADIYNVSYENIINYPEKETKKIINACDLEWDNKCLEFYNNKRPIKTASDTQARKKIYKSSLNSWKNYEKQLINHFKKLNA